MIIKKKKLISWTSSKLFKSLLCKHPLKMLKRQATGREKILAKYIPAKALASRIYKEIPKLKFLKKDSLVRKWVRDMKGHST